MNKHVIAAGLAAVTLAVPAVAAAAPGHHGKDHGQRPARKVMFVFRGSFTAPGTVAVVSGNAQARKGGFVGQAVAFDLANARVIVADTNGDGQRNVADVHDGDLVLVQARLPKGTKFADGSEPAVARKLIDRTAAADAPESSG